MRPRRQYERPTTPRRRRVRCHLARRHKVLIRRSQDAVKMQPRHIRNCLVTVMTASNVHLEIILRASYVVSQQDARKADTRRCQDGGCDGILRCCIKMLTRRSQDAPKHIPGCVTLAACVHPEAMLRAVRRCDLKMPSKVSASWHEDGSVDAVSPATSRCSEDDIKTQSTCKQDTAAKYGPHLEVILSPS